VPDTEIQVIKVAHVRGGGRDGGGGGEGKAWEGRVRHVFGTPRA
jgi:hypothetical protein